jgi:hypothetical protein
MSKPNGCGGEGDFVRPPQFFPKACDDHDLAYDRGGSEKDRISADSLLFAEANDAAAKAPWYKWPLLTFAAPVYFLAVRAFGWRFFKYRKTGEQIAGVEAPTAQDLDLK